MPVKVGKFIYWTPRILSILFILFLAMRICYAIVSIIQIFVAITPNKWKLG